MLTQLYNLIKIYRWKKVKEFLQDKNLTLLDIGCQDLFYYNKLKDNYKITLADCDPKDSLIKKEDIQNFSFKDNSFDVVLCQEVLEHVQNPVKAVQELKRVSKDKLIISVPNEPFFTLFRFLVWEKEHLWSITPEVLKHHLGKPAHEKKIFFKRYYLAVWEFHKE